MLKQLGLHFHRVCCGQVDLVNSDNDRNISRFCVADSFNCLRHNTVFCGHNNNNDVRDVCTARTHLSKGCVTGGVEERDFLTGVHIDLIRANMLRNASGLAGNDIRFAHSVEQGCFTMVNVTHNRHNRRARLEVFFIVLITFQTNFNIGVCYTFDLVTEFLDHQFGSVGVNRLSDCRHNAKPHKLFDNLTGWFGHTVSQFANCNSFRDNNFTENFLCRLLRAFSSHTGLFTRTTLRSQRWSAVTFVVTVQRLRNGNTAAAVGIACTRFRLRRCLFHFVAVAFRLFIFTEFTCAACRRRFRGRQRRSILLNFGCLGAFFFFNFLKLFQLFFTRCLFRVFGSGRSFFLLVLDCNAALRK